MINRTAQMMFVDHWEEFNQKRIEFRTIMKEIIREAYATGAKEFNDDGENSSTTHCAQKYSEEKIKDLF